MLICGVDEAGRGPLAGPVVAGAAVFEAGYINEKIKDSKKLSAKKRELLIEVIKSESISWAVVAVGHQRIKDLNILHASRLAMLLALNRVKADKVLVDGNVALDTDIRQETIVGGDALCVEISAASILAKVYRDWLMTLLDRKYPGYGLSKHAGYPTKNHIAAIAAHGPSRVHRVDFRGVKEHLFARSQSDKIGDSILWRTANG